jgi:hypothetical protein
MSFRKYSVSFHSSNRFLVFLSNTVSRCPTSPYQISHVVGGHPRESLGAVQSAIRMAAGARKDLVALSFCRTGLAIWQAAHEPPKTQSTAGAAIDGGSRG